MKGFTLIEAMVAVSILAISVAAPTYGASRALVAAQNANNQLTASYLAQQGVEYARVYRDSKYLSYYQSLLTRPSASQNGWNDFKNGILTACSAKCSYDPLSGALSFCPGGVCPKLYVHKTTGEYTTSPSGSDFNQTIYTRSINVSTIAADEVDEVRVTSTVSWPFRGTIYKVEIVTHLTRWLP